MHSPGHPSTPLMKRSSSGQTSQFTSPVTQDEDRKEIYIGPTLQHIQPQTDLLFSTADLGKLLLRHKRNSMLLNLSTQSIVQSKLDSDRVVSSTFHSELRVYLIKTLSEILLVNEEGESLGRVDPDFQTKDLMEARFVFLLPMQDGQHEEDPHCREDKVIYVTDENLHIAKVKILFERGLLNNKTINRFEMFLDGSPDSKGGSRKDRGPHTHIDPTIVFDAPEWIENCKLFPEEGFFLCYNKHEVVVFKLPKLTHEKMELHLVYRKSGRTENKVTDIAASTALKQLIFAHESGVIKIYRFNPSKKYIQDLKGHQKECQSLFLSTASRPGKGSDSVRKEVLYSAGLDNTVRIWNLYQFEELYCLRIDLICNRVTLLSEELAFVQFESMRKSCLCKINASKIEPILTENKGGKITNLICDGEWAITLFSNNYAEMFPISSPSAISKRSAKVGLLQDVTRGGKGLGADYTIAPSVVKKETSTLEKDHEGIGKVQENYSEKIQFPLKYGNVKSAVKIRKNEYAIILEKGFSVITLDRDEVNSENFELKKLVYNEEIEHINSDSDSDGGSEDTSSVQEGIPRGSIDFAYRVKKNSSVSKPQVLEKKAGKGMDQKELKEENQLIELIHEKLLGTYLFTLIEDWKGIPTAISICYLTFITGRQVPSWDMDQKKKSPPTVIRGNQSEVRPRRNSIPEPGRQEDIYVVIGTEKGVIYVINIETRTRFTTRVVFHSSAVEFIQEFTPKKSTLTANDEIFFASLQRNKDCCFWSISEDRPPNLYCRVSNQISISHLSFHNSFILIGEKEGKVSVLELFLEERTEEEMQASIEVTNSPFRLKRKDSSRSQSSRVGHPNKSPAKLLLKKSHHQGLYGHMKSVEAGDYRNISGNNIFLTGSQDCSIKMWSGLEKELLFQLKIFDPVSHVQFTRSGIDLLVCHNDQISCLKSENIPQMAKILSSLKRGPLAVKYQHYGVGLFSVNSIFSNQEQSMEESLEQWSPLRTKMRYSLRPEPLMFSMQKPVTNLMTPKEALNSKYVTSFLSNIPQQTVKVQKIKIQEIPLTPDKDLARQRGNTPNERLYQFEANPTPAMHQKNTSESRYIHNSPPSKREPESKLNHQKRYARSEERLKSKGKFFRVSDTRERQSFDYWAFGLQLPRISGSKGKGSTDQKRGFMNITRREPELAFSKREGLIEQIKQSKGRSFSFAGRNSK